MTDKERDEFGDIVGEAKKKLNQSVQSEQLFRSEAEEDLKFRVGEQWPEKIAKDRELYGRPCLKFNLIPKFVRQVTGDARQNVPSVNVVPVNHAASKAVADVLKGMIRYIQYISNANYCYVKGLDDAATMGRGWWKVVTEYTDDNTFDQEIKVKQVENPLAVYVDPNASAPDYRNAEWIIERWWISREAFAHEYGEASEGSKDTLDNATGDLRWYTDDEVCMANFWKKEYEYGKELLHIAYKDATGNVKETEILKSDPALKQIGEYKTIKSRIVKTCHVVCYTINGDKVMEKKNWPGKFIPLIPCIGELTYVDGKPYIHGIVRFSKDPQRNYNYWMTIATEQIALAPRIPWVVTDTMIENYKNEWDGAHEDNRPYLRYTPDPMAAGAKPERVQPPQMSQGHWQMLQQSEQGLYGTTGIFKPSLGEQSNEQSGRAILARQREGDTGTYVYVDNWLKSVAYTGEIIVDLIPRIYDQERVVIRIDEQDEFQPTTINGGPEEAPSESIEDKVRQIYDVRKGKYGVRITTGPNYLTRKQEAANSLLEFMRIYPNAAPILGDLLATSMDWEKADEVAGRLKQLAQSQGLLQSPGGPPGSSGSPNTPATTAPGQTVSQPAEQGISSAQQAGLPGQLGLGPKPVI